jgi:O-antigen/teichoic acid export membrane protein
LLGLSLAASLATAALVSFAVAAFGGALTAVLHADALRPYLWTIPLGVFLLGATQSMSTFAVRERAFRRVGIGKAVEGAGKGLLQLGLHGAAGLGLLLADLAARTLGVLVLARRCGLARLRSISAASVRRVAHRYRDFPLFGGPAALLNAAGLQSPALLFAALYGLDVAGLFALGQRVVAMPTALVGQAASQVYLGEGARLARQDPAALHRMFVRTTRRLVLLGALPLGVVALAAPALFGVVFGEAWVEAGHYVRILAATFAIQFVVVPLSQTLSILERQRWQLAWDTTRFLLVAGAISGSAALGFSPRAAVTAFAVAAGVAYLALHGLGYVAVRNWDGARCTFGHGRAQSGP